MEKIKSGSIAYLPLVTIISYYLFTLFLFNSEIISWPLRFSVETLNLAVVAVCVAIIYGYVKGVEIQKNIFGRFSVPNYFWILILLGGVANFASIGIYTQANLADLFTFLTDQNYAYLLMLDSQNNIPLLGRLVLSIVKLITVFGSLAVFPILFFNYGNLKTWQKAFCFFWIFSNILFSVVRGTDKELFDLLFFAASMLAIKLFHSVINLKVGYKNIFKSFCYLFFAIVVIMSVFTMRKSQRLGGASTFCVYHTGCLNHENQLSKFVDKDFYFAIGLVSSYLTQGYYGLGLSLEVPFSFSYGGGVFPAAKRAFDLIRGEESLSLNYVEKLKNKGWHDSYTWSTSLPWLASDFTFYGVPFLLLLFALLMGWSWIVSVRTLSLIPSILFVLTTYLFVYLPANNQLFQSLDLTFAFIVTLLLFLKDELFSNKSSYSQ